MRNLFSIGFAPYLVLVLFLSSCALVSPYQITFTTQNEQVVDPQINTLDFVVSAPALAYISEIDCDDAEEIELLPVVTDEMKVKTAHNLALTALNGAPGSECEITVTAFDQSTTASSRAEISVLIAGEELEEIDDVEEMEEVEILDVTVEEPASIEESAVEEPAVELQIEDAAEDATANE